jgi:hypothetical protein
LITDDPLEEIQRAGHNRAPISLTRNAADARLDTQHHTIDELYDLLDDIHRPLYEHALAA